MRDIGPVLKDRKKIGKSVGRAEKKVEGLGGGLESKSVYKVMVRKEAVGEKPEVKIQKKFSLISCSWWKILDTFLCYAFPPRSYCVFVCGFILFPCFTIHIYVNNLGLFFFFLPFSCILFLFF